MIDWEEKYWKLQKEYNDLYEGHENLSYDWARLKKENKELVKVYKKFAKIYYEQLERNENCYKELVEKENQLKTANKNLERVLSKYYVLKHEYEGDIKEMLPVKKIKTLKQEDTIKYICDTFETQEMLTIAMEECAELIQAISKVKRYGLAKEYYDNLNEEIADVNICIDTLFKMGCANINEASNYYEKKLERLFNRAKELENEE